MGVSLPGGPEWAVVPGGKVGFDLWLGRHERQHLRAARAVEGGPGHRRPERRSACGYQRDFRDVGVKQTHGRLNM